jgi:F-type H+-transporting ATPase subunit delta
MVGPTGLRGASADALAELERAVRSSSGTLADAADTGEELFGVAAVLRSEPALRRAATDSSVEGEAKSGLASAVFGSTLTSGALDVVVDAFGRRWTRSWDLPDALERLAVIATVRSGGKDGGRISDELFAVTQLLEENPELRSALSDSSRTTDDRNALLAGLLDGQVLPASSTLLRQAVASRNGSVERVLGDYQRIAASAQDEMVAVVRTAQELDPKDLDRLATALGKQYATTVHLHVVVDPDLVGGLRIEIGDDRIDGTISGRIDDARRRLVG